MEFMSRRDPISDADASFLIARAAQASTTGNPFVAWHCDGKYLSVLVSTDDVLELPHPRVFVRFDRQTPSSGHEWDRTTTGTSMAPPFGIWGAITNLAKSADSLHVRYSDWQGTNHDFVVSLRGLSAGLDRLLCAPPGGTDWMEQEVFGRRVTTAAPDSVRPN
jgi:hypothetical protein